MLSQPRLRPGAPHGSNASIKLPSLPPFHPANFPSAQHSSAGNTPSSGVTSSQPPVSPRQQQRQYNDIQKQLQAYQRDIIATAMRRSPVASSCGVSAKPDSPKLEPLGSPGPVTPLILEEQGGYIASAARSAGGESATQDELVDRLIREEARRRGERPTSVGKP
ncbi:hypothetical protein EV356DRAFT_528506 [Viridothelium virens]|uniref:Uncharacterized protein n=1 Tax=Viridothelium virens TaxID=1048519 RepID=A0A6A6HP28_VIRVR|nr:hypothetical protein EV356DRAFT_528506 [Viridothelium virens]